MYYSATEEKIMEEGTENIYPQKKNLDFLQKINVQNNDHVRDDVEYIRQA
jgi:hypothetical protein